MFALVIIPIVIACGCGAVLYCMDAMDGKLW